MDYPLTELSQTSGLPVDTIRYYQTIGLLHAPAHRGRNAVYDHSHLDRLRLIRSISARGLSLKVIGMLLTRQERLDSDQALIAALEEQATGPCYTSAEMAERLGIPRALLRLVERSGLTDSVGQEDAPLGYSEADLRVARGAIRLRDYGFPLGRLLALAVRHDRAMRRTVDEAIELFNQYVRKLRKRDSGRDADDEAVARAFQDILPIATALVAHHFQKLLIGRALKGLKKSGERRHLQLARKVAAGMRLRLRLP